LKKYLAALALCVSLAASAETVEGVVVFGQTTCNLYIVKTNYGFLLGRWFGGYLFSTGIHIFGDLNTVATVDVLSGEVGAYRASKLFIEDLGLTEDDAVQRFREKCPQ
jgi:hypothetical protein